MDVAVVGAGAIGSALGAMLSRTTSVTVIGHQNPHFDQLQAGSLTLIDQQGASQTRSVSVTTDHTAVRDVDIVVLAVKSYDTTSALEDIEPSLSNTPVVTLQNGLGNVENMRAIIDSDQVIGGTTTMGARIVEPGTVHLTSAGETRIGRPWGPSEGFLESVANTFQDAGLPTTVTQTINKAIWEKVLINVGINPVAALGQVPNGDLRSGPGFALMRSAIEEAAPVATAEGFDVENPVAKARAVIEATAENHASMLRDLEAGSRTEIDALNGAIVDRAATHGIDVPINQTVTRAIRLRSEARD